MARRHFLTAAILLFPALCSSGWRGAPARFGRAPVVIDAGHGGHDLGGVVRRVYEKDIVLSVSRKLRDVLQERWNIPARLTRNTDEFVALNERIDKSLNWKGAVFVSLHADKVRYKNVKGITVYSFRKMSRRRRTGRTRRKGLPYIAPPSKAHARRGAALARVLSKSLKDDDFEVDPPEFQNYYVLKNHKMPSVLVELGYLSHKEEWKKLQDPAYQQRLAETLARGIKEHLDRTSPIPLARAEHRAVGTVRRAAGPLRMARPAL